MTEPGKNRRFGGAPREPPNRSTSIPMIKKTVTLNKGRFGALCLKPSLPSGRWPNPRL
jgi:hypothetical protein